MNLLILDGPRSPAGAAHLHYRGTYRAHPTYCDGLPQDHEINKLFLWFLEEGGELGLVHDLTKSSRYAELLNLHMPKFVPRFTHFEVVEVSDGENPPETKDQLLGFDLSAGYNNSLLWWWGQTTEPRASLPSARAMPLTTTLPEHIQALYDLVHRTYAPQLNCNGLFKTLDIASECLRVMDALQQLSPNLYEGEDLLANFHVVGIHLVPPKPGDKTGENRGKPGRRRDVP